MVLVNRPAIMQLEEMIKGLPTMRKQKALEVACGSCHVTDMLLRKHFDEIELMDYAQDAIQKAEQLQRRCNKIVCIYHQKMQDFTSIDHYNCIVLRYCIGYLDDTEARLFLRKVTKMLSQ